jgi:hypothetical protein
MAHSTDLFGAERECETIEEFAAAVDAAERHNREFLTRMPPAVRAEFERHLRERPDEPEHWILDEHGRRVRRVDPNLTFEQQNAEAARVLAEHPQWVYGAGPNEPSRLPDRQQAPAVRPAARPRERRPVVSRSRRSSGAASSGNASRGDPDDGDGEPEPPGAGDPGGVTSQGVQLTLFMPRAFWGWRR